MHFRPAAAWFPRSFLTAACLPPGPTSACAASRIAEHVPSTGTYAYGGYPDIDTLYREQALVTDRKKREALLFQIQQLVHERVRFGPIWEYVWPSGVGPRVRSRR
jgi:ABC-type transport system substrate-binding protein